MNKQEFTTTLKRELATMPAADRDEILYDYEEHFSIGLGEGKTEEDIAASLGDPRALARQFNANYHVKVAENDTNISNTFRAVFATLGLGLLNVIFILGPFLAILGTLFGFFIAAVAIFFSGITVFAAAVFDPFLPFVVDSTFLNFVHPASAVFASIGLVSLGLLFFIGDVYLTKYFFIGTIHYLKLNLKIIKGV